MTDLATSYMGIPLPSPLVVAASSISGMIDRVRLAEQAGAGALVIRSLFEEQIQVDALKMEENLRVGAESYAEASSYFPDIHPGAAEEHLHWIEKTRAAGQIERELLDIVGAVRGESKLPLAVKLSPFYTSVSHVAHALDGLGIDGLVLFNRFVQPDIDPATESLLTEVVLSNPDELRLLPRWAALLSGPGRGPIA